MYCSLLFFDDMILDIRPKKVGFGASLSKKFEISEPRSEPILLHMYKLFDKYTVKRKGYRYTVAFDSLHIIN